MIVYITLNFNDTSSETSSIAPEQPYIGIRSFITHVTQKSLPRPTLSRQKMVSLPPLRLARPEPLAPSSISFRRVIRTRAFFWNCIFCIYAAKTINYFWEIKWDCDHQHWPSDHHYKKQNLTRSLPTLLNPKQNVPDLVEQVKSFEYFCDVFQIITLP